MGILQGKNILVTGVLTDSSIAFHIAKIAQEEGATVLLSSYGRVMSLTTRISGRLPNPAPVIELDVTNQEHLDALADGKAAGDQRAGDDRAEAFDGEYAINHLPEASNIPVSQLRKRLTELDPLVPTVVYCAGGYRSSIAASVLRANGFRDVSDVLGGFEAILQVQN